MTAGPTSTGADGSDTQVLLLDDEEAILLPTARYFRRLGFSVDVARTREDAEQLLERRRYDLAILDLRLGAFGGAGGLEVLREIRRRGSSTSVIVLSAYVSAEVEAEARALGADAVLAKPQPLPVLAHMGFALMRGRVAGRTEGDDGMQPQISNREEKVRCFFEASEQTLASMEQAVVGLEEAPGDAAPLKTLHQAARELQYGAGSLGFPELADVTALLEDILERARSGSIAVSREVTDVLALSMDVIRELLAEARR